MVAQLIVYVVFYCECCSHDFKVLAQIQCLQKMCFLNHVTFYNKNQAYQ